MHFNNFVVVQYCSFYGEVLLNITLCGCNIVMNLKVITCISTTMSPLFDLSEKGKRKRRHFQKFNSANIGFYSVRPTSVNRERSEKWYGDIEFV